MQLTMTLSDILIAAGIVVPAGSGALYWSMRMAIRDAVKDLELRVATGYMSKTSCETIRAACDKHRHEVADAVSAAAEAASRGKYRSGG